MIETIIAIFADYYCTFVLALCVAMATVLVIEWLYGP